MPHVIRHELPEPGSHREPASDPLSSFTASGDFAFLQAVWCRSLRLWRVKWIRRDNGEWLDTHVVYGDTLADCVRQAHERERRADEEESSE